MIVRGVTSTTQTSCWKIELTKELSERECEALKKASVRKTLSIENSLQNDTALHRMRCSTPAASLRSLEESLSALLNVGNGVILLEHEKRNPVDTVTTTWRIRDASQAATAIRRSQQIGSHPPVTLCGVRSQASNVRKNCTYLFTAISSFSDQPLRFPSERIQAKCSELSSRVLRQTMTSLFK